MTREYHILFHRVYLAQLVMISVYERMPGYHLVLIEQCMIGNKEYIIYKRLLMANVERYTPFCTYLANVHVETEKPSLMTV